MTNKLYEKIKQIIRENRYFLVFLAIVMVLCFLPIPYYIHAPGGLVNISDRVTVENGHQSAGSLNLAYVSEYKGTIPMYLFSLVKHDWDAVKLEEVVESNETARDSEFRSHLLLEEATQAAVINAFRFAQVKYEVKKEDLFVSYVDPKSQNELKIGDQIIAVNGTNITTKEQLLTYVKEKQIGEELAITIKRNQKKKTVAATVYESSRRPKIGVVVTSKKEVVTNPEVTFDFKMSESGPSGGMMMSLAIYNSLTKEDVTHGKKIAGTGTIDEQGNVGEIGGIQYKIIGAAKEKVDVFFVPAGENYTTAKQLKEERHYDMDVVEVKTFADVLEYLEKQL